MPYEPYKNVDSGLTEPFIKGLLPLDESGAQVIGYRKDITVAVFLNLFGETTYKDLTGEWQVRLRENDSRNAAGEYTSKILFEQTVKWTARVIAVNILGLYLVTWWPLGNQRTSIVDGQECAVIQNINAPTVNEMEAYGKTGAWRFLDTGINFGNMTPEQKYGAENGFTIFKDEGTAVLDGYHFFATWQCRFYKCNIPQGAILETVYDNWQSASLTEVHYKLSWLKGALSDAALFDERSGHRYWTRVVSIGDVKSTNVYRWRRGRSPVSLPKAELAGIVDSLGLDGARLFKLHGGAILCFGTSRIWIKGYISLDCGKTWQNIMNEVANIIILGSCMAHDASTLWIYGKDNEGRPKFAILKNEKDRWRLSEWGIPKAPEGVQLPTRGVNALIAGKGGVLRMMVRDADRATFRVLVSTDGGRSYADELLAGEEAEEEEKPNV